MGEARGHVDVDDLTFELVCQLGVRVKGIIVVLLFVDSDRIGNGWVVGSSKSRKDDTHDDNIDGAGYEKARADVAQRCKR